MNFLADENVQRLRENDHDVLWMKQFRPGVSDDEVVKIATADQRIIITSDKGFGERVVRRGLSLGVILLRLHTLSPAEFVAVALRAILSRDDWERYLTVIDPFRIRTIPLERNT